VGFWVETKTQLLVDYDVIMMVYSSSKVLKLNICLYRRKRSLSTFADPGFLSTFYTLFCVTELFNIKNDFYDITSTLRVL